MIFSSFLLPSISFLFCICEKYRTINNFNYQIFIAWNFIFPLYFKQVALEIVLPFHFSSCCEKRELRVVKKVITECQSVITDSETTGEGQRTFLHEKCDSYLFLFHKHSRVNLFIGSSVLLKVLKVIKFCIVRDIFSRHFLNSVQGRLYGLRKNDWKFHRRW